MFSIFRFFQTLILFSTQNEHWDENSHFEMALNQWRVFWVVYWDGCIQINVQKICLQRISWFVYSMIWLAKATCIQNMKKKHCGSHLQRSIHTHVLKFNANISPRLNFGNATARIQFCEKLLFSLIQRTSTCLFALHTEKDFIVKINIFRWWDLWKNIKSPLESESFEYLNIFFPN